MQILSWTFLGATGALLATFSAAAPAHAGAGSVACVGTGSGVSCAGVWGEAGGFPRIIDVPPYRNDDERIASEARERKWSVRCQPLIRQDRYGVGRYEYAAPGCEFGKSED